MRYTHIIIFICYNRTIVSCKKKKERNTKNQPNKTKTTIYMRSIVPCQARIGSISAEILSPPPLPSHFSSLLTSAIVSKFKMSLVAPGCA